MGYKDTWFAGWSKAMADVTSKGIVIVESGEDAYDNIPKQILNGKPSLLSRYLEGYDAYLDYYCGL